MQTALNQKKKVCRYCNGKKKAKDGKPCPHCGGSGKAGVLTKGS